MFVQGYARIIVSWWDWSGSVYNRWVLHPGTKVPPTRSAPVVGCSSWRTCLLHMYNFSSVLVQAVLFSLSTPLMKIIPKLETSLFVSLVAIPSLPHELLTHGGFNLTEWLSNSKMVMKSIPLKEWAKSLHKLDLDWDDLPYDRTLGVLWDTESDCFTFNVKAMNKPATKRGLLSMKTSVCDPLGFAGPFVLKAEIPFQELCCRKAAWDDKLLDDLAEQWHRWIQDIPLLSNLMVSRCLRTAPIDTSAAIQLHHFCSASESAFGAVSYLRVNNECKIVMSKGRLAPINTTSIPLLELLSAVLATEPYLYSKRYLELPIAKTYFWTDSTIFLQYIKNQSCRFQIFVANRVAKICEQLNPKLWWRVSSANNPADDVSHGMTAPELIASERWIKGLAFLHLTEDCWPEQPVLPNDLPCDAEVKKKSTEVYTANLGSAGLGSDAVGSLLEQYSDWHRLKYTTAILLA